MAGVITPAQYVGGGGGGAVSSVFGRSGAVIAAIGDYTYTQVGADQAGAAAAAQAAAQAFTTAGFAPITNANLLGTPTAPTAAPGDTSTQLATDAFVAAAVTAAVQGLAIKPSVQAATVAALPANTYSNGASGVGATLTAVLPGVLVVDGITVALGNRVLVQDEVAAANNGIYVVTTLGTVSVAYILTRAADMNQAAEVPGAFTFVEAGTVNAGAGFTVAGAGPYVIGTTAINWTQFSGAGEITAGAGLTKTGNTLALTVPVAIANGGTGQITAVAALTALGGITRAVALAASQSGGMTGIGYVGAMGNPASSVGPSAPSVLWVSGGIYGQLLFCDPTMTPNGYVTLTPWGGGALAGTYLALFNSAGTQLGITADLSAQAANGRGIRVPVTGWTAVPSNGLIYMLYTNATQASNAGPYIIHGQAYNNGYPQVSIPANVSALGFVDTGPTTMPASLTFGANGVPSGFSDASPYFFQAFLD
jgi:hypothetical protein